MRPLDNPYAPGAGSPPPAITGRDAEIAVVEILLARAVAGRPFRSPLLTGLRGTGKTVLLNRFEAMGREAGWVTATKEIPGESREDEPFREVMAALARRAILDLSRLRRLEERGTWLLRVLTSFRPKITISPTAGAEFDVTLEPAAGIADSGTLEDDLADLFIELGTVAREHETGVLFLLDEIQNLSRADLSALITALHRVSQKALPVAVVAAGLPQLPTLAAEVQTYAERLFDFRSLGRLDSEAAAAALAAPAAALSAAWEPDALAAAVAGADRWPYFLQEWGQKAWDVALASPITEADVTYAAEAVTEALDRGFFEARYGRATDAERVYLGAMATLGDGPYESAAIAAVIGSTQQAMSVRRGALIKKGLIYSPRLGMLAFTAPSFEAFLRRRENVDNLSPAGASDRVDSLGATPRFETLSLQLATPSISATSGPSPKDQAS